MRKLYFILLLIANISIFSQDWQYQYLCEGSVPGKNVLDGKMAFLNDIPYISFKDENVGYRVSVMKKKSDSYSFEYLGIAGISIGEANSPVIAVGNEEIYVAYSDTDLSKKISLKKFNGTNWQNIGIEGFTPGKADQIKLKFIGSTPYVFFRDFSADKKGSVMKYDGANWVFVGTQGFTSAQLEDSGSDFEVNGTSLYCIYKDTSNGNKATVKYFTTSDWTTLGIAGFTSGEISFPKIAIDANTPIVAFQDSWFGKKATVMKYESSNWSSIGNPGFSTGQINNIALTINNSTPYVVFEDQNNCGNSTTGRRLSAYKQDGTNWTNFGSSCFSTTSINVYSFINSFVFNKNIAYVSHQSGFCAPGIVAKIAISTYNGETLDISEKPIEKITISPNPFEDKLKIQNIHKKKLSYEVIDFTGKKIESGDINVNSEELNLSNLNSGIYILRIFDGKQSYDQKIIKK